MKRTEMRRGRYRIEPYVMEPRWEVAPFEGPPVVLDSDFWKALAQTAAFHFDRIFLSRLLYERRHRRHMERLAREPERELTMEQVRKLHDLGDADAEYGPDDPRQFGVRDCGRRGWTRGPVYSSSTGERLSAEEFGERFSLSYAGGRQSPLARYFEDRYWLKAGLGRVTGRAALIRLNGEEVFYTDPERWRREEGGQAG